MNARYITFPFTVNPTDLVQRAFTYIKSKVPGWTEHSGELDVWVIEAVSGEAADIATLVNQVPKAIFRYFGATMFNVQPIEAASAVVETTWFFTDDVGHTIPAGAQVGIRDSVGELHIFTVISTVVIGGGATQTAEGQVLAVANVPGAQATDLGVADDPVDLVDPLLTWIDHITQAGPTTGGVDGESDDDYIDRLSVVLQTMSPEPIQPRDFGILAKNVAGVQRAAAIDGYNPDFGTFGNERTMTVVSLDVDGATVSPVVEAAVSAYLESLRETNFVVKTMDAAVKLINVTTHVKVTDGYSITDVADRVQTAIESYLDPRQWGIDETDNPNDPRTWNNATVIYYLEMATIISNVPGVERITLLEMGLDGDPMVDGDLGLGGIVPIPNPNTITVQANA